MWPVSPRFTAELNKPVHTVAARIDFLDTDFRVVKQAGMLGDSDYDAPNDALIDGTVDVDTGRGTRRTLTMAILNSDGQFSPDTTAGPFAPTPDWPGYFYVNRLIRLWRGLKYTDGTSELVPVGTFMVDKSEVLVERGMSTVVIQGSDLWKKLAKSQFGTPRTFAKNTDIRSIVSTLASEAGVTRVNLDPLTSRTTASKQIQTDLNFESDETRGEALTKIATDHGLDIYFDPMGTLVMEEFRDPLGRPVVWEFGDGKDDLAFFVRSVLDDDRLYNHAIVVGTAATQQDPPGPIVKGEVKDTDPGSPTNITRIGDRVFRYESAAIGTTESAQKAAVGIFYKHFLIANTVAMEAICNPALEGNDVISVDEDHFIRVDQKFLIKTLSIPLVTSKQKITAKRVIDINPTVT